MNSTPSLSINNKTANSIITNQLKDSQQKGEKTQHQKALIKDADSAVSQIKSSTNSNSLTSALKNVDGRVSALKIENLKTDAQSVLKNTMLSLDVIKDASILKGNKEALTLLNKLASDAKKMGVDLPESFKQELSGGKPPSHRRYDYTNSQKANSAFDRASRRYPNLSSTSSSAAHGSRSGYVAANGRSDIMDADQFARHNHRRMPPSRSDSNSPHRADICFAGSSGVAQSMANESGRPIVSSPTQMTLSSKYGVTPKDYSDGEDAPFVIHHPEKSSRRRRKR